MSAYKLSLATATLINLNIMLGVGIFANTCQLPAVAGALGSLVYIVVGAILFPLIFSFMYLVQRYHEGSFFDYALPLGR